MNELTKPQREALAVLVNADGPVSGGRHRSQLARRARVNSRAADGLVILGLARGDLVPYAGLFGSAFDYLPTPAGIRVACEATPAYRDGLPVHWRLWPDAEPGIVIARRVEHRAPANSYAGRTIYGPRDEVIARAAVLEEIGQR